VPTGELRIETGGTVAAVSATAPHQLTIAFGFDATGEIYHYGEFYDTGGATGEIAITRANNNSYASLDSASYTGVLPTGAWSMRIDESVSAQQIELVAKLGGTTYSQLVGTTTTAPILTTSSRITTYVQNADFRFDYWIVIETLP
jgi:hypothetical protein